MSALVIERVVLHDGTGGTPVDDGVVVVEDGRIAYAGARAQAPARVPGADVLDGGGKHLLPGLIDCHVHITLGAGPDFMIESTCSEEEGVERGIANARAHLKAGVTTVRDLGGMASASFRVAQLIGRGDVPGPRLLTSGRVLTVRGGHAHMIGIEADTNDEIVAAIDLLRRAGAHLVKIVATGGVLTKGVDAQSAKYSEESIRAAADAAHARGMRIAAHAIGAEGIDAALRAGVDSIEHGCYLTEAAVEMLTRGDQWLVATLSAPANVMRGADAVPDYARAKAVEVAESHRASFAKAARAGARIAAGTDAGTPFNPHGGLAGELELYAQEGLEPSKVLVAATGEAARLLALEDVGLLQQGFAGDAVLLDGDPLQDVDAYRKVAAVVQGGRLIHSTA